MASSFPLLLISSLLILLQRSASQPMTLTLVNNCPFTICPAIQPNSGHRPRARRPLPPDPDPQVLPAPTSHCRRPHLGRHRCTHTAPAHLRHAATAGPASSATAWALPARHVWRRSPSTTARATHFTSTPSASSTVQTPMTVTPHEGKGNCPVVGCRENLLATCPDVLQLRGPHGVIGCKSGCEAFGTDELCCRNMYNSAKTCRASTYSEFFKHKCPATFTYAHDSPSLTHECESPKELKVIFCH
ncbi:uncharacterized protein A4U43_C02F1570 [Asparagus officinalis]|uniref:Osmotin-like protein n=1 Tax=Asparagus officinalis TaxID=4686 RepID=A0A5P1FJ60_ASPOF|nr:uncharacterized protein A4U43_C02F1570 [Asparagus officinalis]